MDADTGFGSWQSEFIRLLASYRQWQRDREEVILRKIAIEDAQKRPSGNGD
jgi:hypothetical protein